MRILSRTDDMIQAYDRAYSVWRIFSLTAYSSDRLNLDIDRALQCL